MGAIQKVVVITGASQGIGAALVTAFRERNYRIVATPGDIAGPRAARRVISEGLTAFGRIDTLVNNEGIFVSKPFTDYTEEEYYEILGVNLPGFFHISQLAVAEMVKQGGGHVVNIGTSLVDDANSRVPSALASLTNGGLNAVTKSLAIEYAAYGVRANSVAAGIVKTPMHAPETDEALVKLHPVGRIGEICDIVDAVLYLETASLVTGETLRVDGGQSASH